jgi:hypothetical protein
VAFLFLKKTREPIGIIPKMMIIAQTVIKTGCFLDYALSLRGLQVKLMKMAAFHNEITMGEVEQISMNLPRLKRWQLSSI